MLDQQLCTRIATRWQFSRFWPLLLHCIVNYAVQKTNQWDGRDLIKFVEPCRICPSCHQNYQNKVALDLATAFLAFVTGKYSHYQWMYLDALSQKLAVLQSIIFHLMLEQKEEINYTASTMLTIIRQVKNGKPFTDKRIRYHEQMLTMNLATILSLNE